VDIKYVYTVSEVVSCYIPSTYTDGTHKLISNKVKKICSTVEKSWECIADIVESNNICSKYNGHFGHSLDFKTFDFEVFDCYIYYDIDRNLTVGYLIDKLPLD